MIKTNHNRRTFISSAAAVTALGGTPLLAVPIEARQGAEGFLKDWVAAWNARNAHALASLHTEDCVTINRYGTVIPAAKRRRKRWRSSSALRVPSETQSFRR